MMGVDEEKRGNVDRVSQEQDKIGLDHGVSHAAEIRAEDDTRVRRKIDCVVLPVSIHELTASFGQ